MAALVAHVITGLGSGGAEAALYRLCSASGDDFRHVVISLMDGGVYADRLERLGISVCCLGMPRGRITLSGLRKLRHVMHQAQPTIVQTWMYHADLIGGIVARSAGIRHIVWGIHASNLDYGNRAPILKVVSVCAFLSRWIPKKIISCSTKAIELHKTRGYDATKFLVIPNGYSLDEFHPDATKRTNVRKQLRLPDDALILGTVARFDPLKDHANLIEALVLLRRRGLPFVCLLVGPGIDQSNKELMKVVNRVELRDSVRLLGSSDDIPAIMNALDLHILSSRGEAFPNVLAEAMACEVPCVTTDVGDASFIVGDTGWVVTPRDPRALADAISAALNERARDLSAWKRRQQACRKRVADHFSLERMAAAYEGMWAEVAATSAARR